MASVKYYTAKLKSTGEVVIVYKSSRRTTYINNDDLETEYTQADFSSLYEGLKV